MSLLVSIQKIALMLIFATLIVEIIVLAPQDLADQSNVRLYRRTENAQNFDQIAHDLHLVETGEKKVDWELWSDRAEKQTGKDLWGLNSVLAKFYGEKGVEYKVRGKAGTVSESQNFMQVGGAVETISSDGYVFITDNMIYDPVEKVLVGPGPVEMRGPKDADGNQLNLTGIGLKAFLSQSRVEIQKEVKALRPMKGGHKVTIQSDSAVFLNSERSAQFSGNVIIHYDDMVLKGPNARFILLTKTSELKTLHMDGGVKAQDALRNAVSQQLNIDFVGEKVVFDGKPKVRQGKDLLVGDRITFLDRGERVQVENAKAEIDPNQPDGKSLSKGKVK